MRTTLEFLIPVAAAIVVLLVLSGHLKPKAIVRPLGMRMGRRLELPVVIEQGRRLLAAEREQRAYEYLEKWIQRFPDDPDLRLLWATSLSEVRPQEAVPEVVKAIEMDPDEPIRLTRAAGIAFTMGDVETARSYATRAKELAPSNFPLQANLLNLDSHFAALEGKDELAEKGFRLAIEQEPDGETFAVDLCQFLADRDRRPEALEVIDEALPHSRRRESLERLRGELLGEAVSD